MNLDDSLDRSDTASRTGTATWSRAGDTVTRRTEVRVGVVRSTVSAGRRGVGAVGRGAAVAARWLGSTVTPIGWFLLAVLAAAAAAGAGLGWVEGWAEAVVAAVLLLASVPFLLGSTAYDVRLEIAEHRVVAGTDVHATLHVTNVGRAVALPSVLDVPVGAGLVEVHLPMLAVGATHVAPLAIGARRRAVVRVGPMTVTRGDPIGILHREVSWPQVDEVFVHPVTTRVPPTSAGFINDIDGSPTTRIVDADLAFHAIREYQPGDARRHVHWRATAKTGRLMVQQYEESRRSRLGVLLDVRAQDSASDAEFELAVSAAVSLALQGVRDGREVLLASGFASASAGGWQQTALRTLPTRTPTALLDGASRLERLDAGVAVEEAVALVADAYPDLSALVVVTGAAVPTERLRRAVFHVPPGVLPVVVRADVDAEPTVRRLGAAAVMTIGVIDDLAHLVARSVR